MTQINQPPYGLTDLLGSKQFGDNPSELASTVVAGVELYPFWSVDKERYTRNSNALTGRGIAVSISVPTGEVWMPRVISARHTGLVSASPPIIETLGIRIAALAVGGHGVTVASSSQTLRTTGDLHALFWLPDRLVPLRAGIAIQVQVLATQSGASEGYELECWYDRLTV